MVTAVTAMLTAGGTGLAIASADDGPHPVETGFMVVDSAPTAGGVDDDCPYASPATLTHDQGARL